LGGEVFRTIREFRGQIAGFRTPDQSHVETLLKAKVDPPFCQCHIRRVKTSKPVMPEIPRKSSGMKLVEKYRPRMSRLSDTERQKLMARGLQIIYGNTAAAKSAHRG
jgi:hypothetical protein